METVKLDPEEEIGFMRVDDTDFGSLTLSQLIRQLEVEGFVVLPGMLDTAPIARSRVIVWAFEHLAGSPQAGILHTWDCVREFNPFAKRLAWKTCSAGQYQCFDSDTFFSSAS